MIKPYPEKLSRCKTGSVVCCMSDILSQHFSPKSFFKFFEKDRSVLGIDIGTSSLKIVQARKDKEHGILETYGELTVANYSTAI